MIAALAPVVEHARRAAILVDYDGTLSPIVANPDAAIPLPAARDALAALVGAVGLVGVVSGRPVAFLRDALGIDGATYVGQYGLERWDGSKVVTDPRVEPYRAAVESIAVAATRELPGVRVERKQGLAVVVHWREDPERGEAVSEWARRAAGDAGLGFHPAKMAAEIRPPVAMDKGLAVEALCAGMEVAAFAGDDAGDLKAFDALDRLRAADALQHTARIGVQSSEVPTELISRADVVVDGPAGLATLLDELGVSIRRAPA